MYPYQRTPMGNPYISPIQWEWISYIPQESLENTINIMGTLLGVHPIIPWKKSGTVPIGIYIYIYIYIYGAVGTNSLRLTRSFLSTNGMRMVETPRVKTAFFAIHEYIK